jgi:hypothetical protein
MYLTKHYVMKVCGECMYTLHFSSPRHWLELSDQLHVFVALPAGEPGYPMHRRLGGTLSRTTRYGERIFLAHQVSNSVPRLSTL